MSILRAVVLSAFALSVWAAAAQAQTQAQRQPQTQIPGQANPLQRPQTQGQAAPVQRRPGPLLTPALAPSAVQPQAAADESGVPPLDDLGATRERPLFSSTRRPPVVVAAPDAPIQEAKSLAFELVGIVSGPDTSIAILRNTDSKEETRVPKGQKFGNWTMEEVGDRFVVLSGDAKRVRMRLFNESKAPGVKVVRVGEDGERDAPAAADDNIDEDVEPSSSPEARPAAAAPTNPKLRRDRRARQQLQRQRRRPPSDDE
jgi:general secretion pathway protein N